MVVGASSWFGTHGLALNNTEAWQHFWLLQPLFSNNKSWQRWKNILYLIQTHSYTSYREGLFAGALWWLMHLHILALNGNVAEKHFWLLQPLLSHNKSC